MVPQMTGLNELPGMVDGQLPKSGFEQYVPVYDAKAVERASVERRETRESRIVGVDWRTGWRTVCSPLPRPVFWVSRERVSVLGEPTVQSDATCLRFESGLDALCDQRENPQTDAQTCGLAVFARTLSDVHSRTAHLLARLSLDDSRRLVRLLGLPARYLHE